MSVPCRPFPIKRIDVAKISDAKGANVWGARDIWDTGETSLYIRKTTGSDVWRKIQLG